MTTPKRATCRTCNCVEITGGKGKRGPSDPAAPGQEVDIGLCHGDTIRLTPTSAGAFPPVALDIDWCRHHQDFKPPARKGRSQ